MLYRLHRTGPGSYRTTKPIPTYDGWKALVRLHRKDSLLGSPIYLPEDPAPVKGVPALSSFTRPFIREKKILQREQKSSVSPALTTAAYGAIGAIVLILVLGLGWALTRLGRTAGAPEEPAPRKPVRSAVARPA
ncbi:MAG TPA: hypothetical protein VKB17_09350 [Thermoleophilaceae bacterium]|nr:hypothetical protein [Thermoleophilaceae bacterium]